MAGSVRSVAVSTSASAGPEPAGADPAGLQGLLAGLRPWQLVLLVVAAALLVGSIFIAAALAFTGRNKSDDLRETLPPIPAAISFPKELLKPMAPATVAEIEGAIERHAAQAGAMLGAPPDAVIGSVQTTSATAVACVFTATGRPGVALIGAGKSATAACALAVQGPVRPAPGVPGAATVAGGRPTPAR